MRILEAAELVRKKNVSPVELTRDCLARIDRVNPSLNAFIAVTAESALQEARKAEAEIAAGDWRGPLHGIPIALKDLIDTAGVPTTAASNVFRDRIPAEDAEVVLRLRQAGAVFLGKQNLHEFAYGGSSIVSCFGAVHNAWNTAYIAGGSSGGSSTAVAAGLCYGAIGTDTAGSVREPSAMCGTVGLKPTYGRVSARGVIPLSWSLDHVGPITSSVSDAAAMLQAIAGYDAGDPCSVNQPLGDYSALLLRKIENVRIGVPRNHFFDDLDPEVAAAVEAAILVLKGLKAEIRDVILEPDTDRSLQIGESYAGHRDRIAQTPERYQPETLRRIRAGEKVTEKDLALLRRKLAEGRVGAVRHVFEKVDFLVTPTVPVLPPTLAELEENPGGLRQRELVFLRNTRPFNVWGLPAISLPCGFSKSGLPIGLQIVGPHWGEAQVLSLAHAYEQASEWHKRSPQLS